MSIAIDLTELQRMMSKLTSNDMDTIIRSFSFDDSIPIFNRPSWYYADKKPVNMNKLTMWFKRNINQPYAQRVYDKIEAKYKEVQGYPVTGPVPNTRYITFEQFRSLPSYSMIETALFYTSHDRQGYENRSGVPVVHNSPITDDGYISVQGLRNIRDWANWKSSSLSGVERSIAEAI